MKFRLRFATCVAAALSAYVCAGAILPGGVGSPLFKKRLGLVASAEAQAQTTSNDAWRVQLTALRDSFVDAIKAAGFKSSIEPPQIALDNPPSFGRYDSGANLLHIAAWSEIGPDGEGRFARLKSVLNDPRSPEAIFDDSVNHWIFIHELGHWWQACQHKEVASTTPRVRRESHRRRILADERLRLHAASFRAFPRHLQPHPESDSRRSVEAEVFRR